MKVSPTSKALLTALLLIAPLLAALPGAGASHEPGKPHVALTPAFFSVASGLTVNVQVSDVTASLGHVEYLNVTLPAGATLSAFPPAPDGWVDDGQGTDLATNRLYAQYKPQALTPPSVTIPFAGLSLPCPSGLAALTWRVAWSTLNGGPASLDATHHCDQHPPFLATPLPASATTEAGTLTLTVSDNATGGAGAATVHNVSAYVTFPGGGTQAFTATGASLGIAVDKTKAGTWSYVVESFDKAGNRMLAPASGAFTLQVADATLPTATLTATGPQEAGGAVTVSYTMGDNMGVDAATLFWKLHDGDWSLVESAPWQALDVKGTTSTTAIPPVHDAMKKLGLHLRVADAAGNSVTRYANLTFKDTTPPTGFTLTATPAAPEGAWRAAAPDTIVLDASDLGTPKPRLTVNYTIHTAPATGAAPAPATGTGAAPLALPHLGNASAVHTLYWAVRDEHGNAGPLQGPRAIRVDPAAPTAILENHTTAWRTQPVTVTFIPGAPPFSGLASSGWGIDNVTHADRAHHFASDGVRWLNWSAVSNAGVAASGAGILRLDLTPPSLSVGLDSEAPATGGLHAGNVTLSLAAADATSGVASLTYSLDGGPDTPYAGPVTVTAEGHHVLVAKARDVAGNPETTQTVSFTIDHTAPSAKIFVNDSLAGELFNHSAFVRIEVTDTTSTTAACTLDGATLPLSGALVATDGPHTVSCVVSDAAGRSVSPSRAFRVDRAPPVVTPRGDLGFVQAFGDLAATDTSNVTSVEGWLVSGDGQGRRVVLARDPATGRWGLDASGLPDGRYQLSARATDEHGRTGEWIDALSLHLLTRAPGYQLQLPDGYEQGLRSEARISWTIDAHPAPSQMLVSVNGGPEQPRTPPLVVSTAGYTTLTFRTRDAPGNLGEQRNVTILIDPTTHDAAPPAAPAQNRPPSVSGVTLALQGARAVATPGATHDPDGDRVQLYYRWRVNDTVVAGANGASIAVAPGQRVHVSLTPWDGKAFGPAVEAPVLVVPGGGSGPTQEAPPRETVVGLAVLGSTKVGQNVTFDGGFGDGRTAVAHKWRFSDGQEATGRPVKRAFAAEGPAWVELTVTDDAGRSDTIRKNFTVSPDTPRVSQAFRWRGPDGWLYHLEGHAADTTRIVRELPDHALLLKDGDAILLWRPLENERATEPVARVSPAPMDPVYENRSLFVPLGYVAIADWTYGTLADPQPGLDLVAVLDGEDGEAAWWRDDEGIHFLADEGAALQYALPALTLRGEAAPAGEGRWNVTLSAEGGGPVETLRLLHEGTLLAEEKGRSLQAAYEGAEGAILRGLVRTLDGQEAEARITLPGTTRPVTTPPLPSTPTPEPPTPPPTQDETPGAGAPLAMLALAGAALWAGRRRAR